MEKAVRGRKFSVRKPFCAPRTRRSNRISPMSLLDRFREAVFRLIMLSALSKATHERKSEKAAKRSTSYQYYSYEPHHKEAVADCIEFLKKSAVNEDQPRNSMDSCSDSEVVLPVPVM